MSARGGGEEEAERNAGRRGADTRDLISFEDAGWDGGYAGFQEAVIGTVAYYYKDRAAWEAKQKSKVAFLLHAFLRRAEPLPLELAKKVLQKAKVFCWRPGTDEKDWDDWVVKTYRLG